MRILVLTNMLPSTERPWFGIFVREQAEDLASLGLDVSVHLVNGFASRLNYFRGMERLRGELRRRPVDIVHAHYGLTGAVAVTQRRVPVVTTFHGSDCNGQSAWQTSVSWGVARLCTPIFVSEILRARLHSPDAAVIPAAVDLDVFHPIERDEARARLGLEQGVRIALLPGSRKDRVKRADLFDAALVHARRAVPTLQGASLEGLTREQVALTINAADVTVMTSDYEGSPVTVKESLASLTPVVSVPVGDTRTLLDGLPGCAIVERDPAAIGDAIVSSITAERSVALRQRVEPYGREALARQVIDVYRQTLEKRRASG
jgi:glycosyltransferase involved in cell wall biosynthesis